MQKGCVVILIFLTAIFIWFTVKKLPEVYLNFGKTNLEQKKYDEAYLNLKKAIMLSPNNSNIRYYYVQSLIKVKPTLQVQKELYELSQNNISDTAHLIANRQIAIWRSQILSNIGENYIEQTPLNKDIIRWDITKFPLKVYIKDNSTVSEKYYVEEIQSAFLQWQSATNSFINFRFVNEEKNADIKVFVKEKPKDCNCTQNGCKYSAAFTSPLVKNGILENMTTTMYDSNNLGEAFSPTEIYNTALHEIGHTLGIMGHSYNKDDLMFMTNGRNVTDRKTICSRDLNTLILLYELIPNITNTPLVSFDINRQFFAPIIMGDKKQILSNKIQEAQNYIQSAPEVPNGYIDLASAYVEEKQYKNALVSLDRALIRCTSNDDKFIVYYNFAIIYIKTGDWENALKYANLAKDMNPSAEVSEMFDEINKRTKLPNK